ncbi:TPA: BON domain-containing protein [Candidatus Poribacteria bacterium]|nr:BON domain-containing protein [Candidatus Poribacteria bacterium]
MRRIFGIISLFLLIPSTLLGNGVGVMVTDLKVIPSEGGYQVVIQLDSPTAYIVDDSNLPSKLRVEIMDCGISPKLIPSKPLIVNKGGISRITLSEDKVRGRTYVDILLSERVRYIKRSPRAAKRIVLDLLRLAAPTTQRKPEERVKPSPAPTTTTIVHVTSVTYKPVADGVEVQIKADGPLKGEVSEEDKRLIVQIPNAILAWGITGEKSFDVESDSVRKITVLQKSINPEIVQVEIDRRYKAAYKLLPTTDATVYRLKVESAPVYKPAGTGPSLEGNLLRIPVGYSYTIDVELKDGDSVILGDPTVADAVINAAGDITVNGKSPGRTTLEIWGRKGSLARYIIEVYRDTSWIEKEIRAQIEDPGISVRVVNDVAILDGEAKSEKSRQLAKAIAQAYVNRVVDNVVVRRERIDLEKTIMEALSEQGLSGINVKIRGGVALLSGTVGSESQRTMAEQIAKAYVQNVVNSIQVMLPLDLESNILSQLNMPNVSVKLLKDAIILSGTVETEQQKTEAERLASVYSNRVINLIQVKPSKRTDEEITAEIGISGVTARWVGDQIYLEGTVKSGLDSKFAKEVARKYTDRVVNRIRVSKPIQINVKVKVLEVNRSALSRLGVSWSQGVTFSETSIPSQPFRIGRISRVSLLNARIDALISSGSARLLAEPNLTTISGQQATSLSGGEVPLITETLGAPGIGRLAFGRESREYGVKLTVTPTVEEDGYISVQLDSEVSEISREVGFYTPLGRIGTFATRKIQANVRARDGETVVLGGLLQQREVNNKTRLPILGYIPILGHLFSYTRKEKVETELIYIMTPKIIREGGSVQEIMPQLSTEAAERELFTW